MSENKLGAIKLSEEDVLKLKNDTLRVEFLESAFQVWREIPELDLRFYKIDLPFETSIVITEYISSYTKKASRRFCIVDQHTGYSPCETRLIDIVTRLRETSKMIKARRRKK